MMSVRSSLKISVTTEPIGFYFLGNIYTGPVVVLGYFLGCWVSSKPTKTEKIPPIFLFNVVVDAPVGVLNFLKSPIGTKPLEAKPLVYIYIWQ